jgi:hypothetical protein
VGPRAVLDAVVKRKIPSPHRESNPRTSILRTGFINCTGHMMPNEKVIMKDEFGGTWKKAVVASFKLYPYICVERLRKLPNTISR